METCPLSLRVKPIRQRSPSNCAFANMNHWSRHLIQSRHQRTTNQCSHRPLWETQLRNCPPPLKTNHGTMTRRSLRKCRNKCGGLLWGRWRRKTWRPMCLQSLRPFPKVMNSIKVMNVHLLRDLNQAWSYKSRQPRTIWLHLQFQALIQRETHVVLHPH